MPRIIGGTISYEEHIKHVKRLKGKGYEAHESEHEPIQQPIKKPKQK
jgi:hypothetical protein